MSSSDYARQGPSNPVTMDDIDPVKRCVGNTFFDKTGNPQGNLQADFCPRLMAQRCAAKWDDYCEAYLFTSNYDSAGNTFVNKQFLEDTARKKYCRMANDVPGAHCAMMCESFNPEGQTSVEICNVIGAQNFLDKKKEMDLTGSFPQDAKLNPISPLYMNRCPETCDAKNTSTTDALGPNDLVLNKCIEHATCDSVLMDLAYNAVKNGLKVTNPAFNQIISYAKIDKSLNPNTVTKIAKSFGIPPAAAVNALQFARYGMTDSQASPVSPTSPVQENYNTNKVVTPKQTIKQSISMGQVGYSVLTICVLILICFIVSKFLKK